MNIYFLGDLHFNNDHEWSQLSIEFFTNWFNKSVFTNPKEDILIQLGDVFDKATNYGSTVHLVTQFFEFASNKFKSIYILGGNHDLGLKNKRFQYATEFLSKAFGNICCVYEEDILNISNINITMLPFKRVKNQTLDSYYSDLDNKYKNSTITCGHVAIKEEGSFFGGIDISTYNTQFVMGHIHTRNGKYKDCYTGSVLPNKINENDSELQRCIKIFNTKTSKFSELSIPQFISYKSVNFGDTIPTVKEIPGSNLTLYTVKNCKHLQEAKNYYQQHYIYNIEKPIKNDAITSVSKTNLLLSPAQALEMMIKEQKIVMKRKTNQLVKELL
jgi:UDP-2,3-diacylglucosamine pyrophosphatase LpxH